MNNISERFTFITPCFCAGADVKHAEVRAPSIRGQLRWWFRVLGGTPEQEDRVFGSVHGNVSSSSLVVRVTEPTHPQFGEPKDLPQQNRELYYLFHFACVSSNNQRVFNKAWFKDGTSFGVDIRFRRDVNPQDLALFERAWNAFKLLGSLGLRQTRGIGAFVSKQAPTFEELKKLCADLNSAGIRCWSIKVPDGRLAWCGAKVNTAHMLLEAALGYLRKQGFSGNDITPLGTSTTIRQASALHLRPVLTAQGALPVLFFAPQVLSTAPQSRSQLYAAKTIELLKLLDDSSSFFRYPYKQKASSPDERSQASFVRLN